MSHSLRRGQPPCDRSITFSLSGVPSRSSTGKALVSKLSCHRQPAVKDDTATVDTTSAAAKPTKARRSTKAPLMIAARGQDEQLVVADAQVVVPTYDGPTEAPLPPPATLFASATTLDRLAREEAIRQAQQA